MYIRTRTHLFWTKWAKAHDACFVDGEYVSEWSRVDSWQSFKQHDGGVGRLSWQTDGRLGVGRRVLDVVSDCDCASSLRLSAHGVIPTCSMITSPSCCRVSSVLLLHRLNIFIASKLTEISKSTGNKYSTKMIDCRHVNPEIRRLKKIYIEHQQYMGLYISILEIFKWTNICVTNWGKTSELFFSAVRHDHMQDWGFICCL